MGWQELYAYARDRRHGAFAVRDAPMFGLTSRQVAARAFRDPWPRPYPDIVFVPGFAVDHRSHLAAAQLYLGESAAASDLSALWLYDLIQRSPARPHLLLPHARRVQPPRTVIRRSRYVEPADRTTVDGISTLRLPFLLLAVSPRAQLDTLLGIAFDARQRGLLALEELVGRLDTVGRVPGRKRVEVVAAALARDGSDSMFEARVRTALRAAGLRPSAAPYPVPTRDGRVVHLDIAFPAERIAIECQGHVAHSSRRQLERDARRDNAIATSGDWVVLKLTWHRFTTDWSGFVADLRSAMDARQAGRGGAPPHR